MGYSLEEGPDKAKSLMEGSAEEEVYVGTRWGRKQEQRPDREQVVFEEK